MESKLQPVVYFRNGTVKVYGEIYSAKSHSGCPRVIKYNSISKTLKVSLKHVIMRPLRHQQRYEAAWVKLIDKKSMEPVCLTSFENTMRFYIQDGVHRCHAAYDAGYDFVPAFVLLEKQEPEWLKENKTFDNQPRNLFERMQLPEKIIPEKCQHRMSWLVEDSGASIPFVCGWCESKFKCFKDLVGTEITEFIIP